MKKLILVVFYVLFTASCSATRLLIPEDKGIRIAVTGYVSDEYVINKQGVAGFGADLSKYEIDWDTTQILSNILVNKLREKGYVNVANLTGNEEYYDLVVDTNLGTAPNKVKSQSFRDLLSKGYSVVIYLRDFDTYYTSSKRMPGKGLLIERGIPHIYGSVSTLPLVLSGEKISLAYGTYEGCPKEDALYTQNAFVPVQGKRDNTDYSSKDAIEMYKEEIFYNLEKDIESSLCYFFKR
ncbi:hypothetical protein QFX18_03510 [Saccharophagus degradans]|uniref:hypothetical protein n=1 Tax=Saccharophagus degradans TaxID=86304 RepID=UPI00247805B0|nr:hypothetical protein [Saccharophagus degradans]WGO99127.1 hypothetical protein QFX18_03510 [Saccharophagus degradans]